MYDLIIIGSGPAGMTAGIYAKRANLKVAVIEGDAPGGQLVSTGEIENYTGFTKLAGVDLAMEMFNHGMSLGVEYIFAKVLKVNDGHLKEVVLNDRTIKTKAVLIATGAKPRKLGLENEEFLSGKNISWCAICDGPLYKNRDVVVVGGGNSAVEEASYLATLANTVTVVQNLDKLTADKKAIDILFKHDNVKVFYNSLVNAFLLNDDKSFKGVEIINKDKVKIIIEADGVFEYVGLIPSTESFKDLNILNDFGYIPTNEKMETNLKGIYAAGDVREKQIRQVVTATSDGAIAVQNVLKYLEVWD